MPTAKPRRVIVVTNAKPAEMATHFLADRERFPLSGMLTTDLAKAHRWLFPAGCRRYLKKRPELKGFRRIWLDWSVIETAMASDQKAATAEPGPLPPGGSASASMAARPRHSHHGRPRPTIRSTKLDPNKRAKAARRKRAFRTIRKALGKPKLRRPSKSLKVA